MSKTLSDSLNLSQYLTPALAWFCTKRKSDSHNLGTQLHLTLNTVGCDLAFVISPNNKAYGDAGGHLGIPPGAVAVEFETSKDHEDVNRIHLGPTVFFDSADLHTIKAHLRRGGQVKTWIDYSGATHQLNISHIIDHHKPPKLLKKVYVCGVLGINL